MFNQLWQRLKAQPYVHQDVLSVSHPIDIRRKLSIADSQVRGGMPRQYLHRAAVAWPSAGGCDGV